MAMALDHEPIRRLTRDLRATASTMTSGEARYLVDLYYQVQDFRIQAGGQKRASDEQQEPHALVSWLAENFGVLEGNIQRALGAYSQSTTPGQWAMSIYGIGPVISAGFLAHIDIERAPTVGHIWRFAGLDDPRNYEWKKGQKRPWNARLKVLCWKTGESFKKFHRRDECIYGKVYAERKALEVERNEAGLFADQAAYSLETKNVRDAELRATLEAGRLPAMRLDLRAMRYATKLFLSHLHHVMYEDRFGEPPPKPYIIAHGEHTHFIGPPNWPMA